MIQKKAAPLLTNCAPETFMCTNRHPRTIDTNQIHAGSVQSTFMYGNDCDGCKCASTFRKHFFKVLKPRHFIYYVSCNNHVSRRGEGISLNFAQWSCSQLGTFFTQNVQTRGRGNFKMFTKTSKGSLNMWDALSKS